MQKNNTNKKVQKDTYFGIQIPRFDREYLTQKNLIFTINNSQLRKSRQEV